MNTWSCEQGEAVEWLGRQPDDSIDLLMTSPPYIDCRTYGLTNVSLKLDAWVAWMLEVVKAAAPKVKGLIAINCEGKTSKFRYQPAPFLLAADLHRAGYHLRKPAVYYRAGIPGSGGKDWLKNNWEPVLCIARPGRLPWSEPTACGRAPKYIPGGQVSYRKVNGQRVVVATGKEYKPPALANPGNVIKCSVGGGRMGHPLANENEAPFALRLAEFFVLSFCPPGGLVCDPFVGSGTTCHAAVGQGRRFTGCDLRQSQVDLTHRRMVTVTPSLYERAA